MCRPRHAGCQPTFYGYLRGHFGIGRRATRTGTGRFEFEPATGPSRGTSMSGMFKSNTADCQNGLLRLPVFWRRSNSSASFAAANCLSEKKWPRITRITRIRESSHCVVSKRIRVIRGYFFSVAQRLSDFKISADWRTLSAL